jgi:hypothetical protein
MGETVHAAYPIVRDADGSARGAAPDRDRDLNLARTGSGRRGAAR